MIVRIQCTASGRSHGIRFALFADRPNYYCTEMFSAGFKVLLHDPTEVPRMGDYGFVVPVGQLTNVAVRATLMDASADVRVVAPAGRECVLPDEQPLRYFRTYSRRNCQLERETAAMQRLCGCVLYSMPQLGAVDVGAGMASRICRSGEAHACYRQAVRTMRSRSAATNEDSGQCLPGCTELTYRPVSLSAASLHVGDELLAALNLTQRDVRQNFSSVSVFFDSSFVETYKRDSYNDFTQFLCKLRSVRSRSRM